MSLPCTILMTIAAAAVAFPVAAAMMPTPQSDLRMMHSVPLAGIDRQLQEGLAQGPRDTYCDTTEAVGISLVEDYAEELRSSVGGNGGSRMDFWASTGSGTWTVVYTPYDNMSCVAASGIGWTDTTHPLAVSRLVGFPG